MRASVPGSTSSAPPPLRTKSRTLTGALGSDEGTDGPVGETVTLRWKDGLFLPAAALGGLEKLAREQKVDEPFSTLLDRWNGQGRNVSDKKTANTYAPTRFSEEPEAKADKATRRELSEAMERLFRAGKIRVASYGRPSKGWSRVERK